jgi:hypothetical protein
MSGDGTERAHARRPKSVGTVVAAGVAGVVLFAVLAYASVSLLTSADAADGSSGLEADAAGLSLLAPGTRVLVREVDPDATRRDGQVYELSADGELRRIRTLKCKRVHAVSGGPGVCLRLSGNKIDYEGVVFDERYRPRVSFLVDGVPDRARISPEGRYAGYTTFDEAGAEGYFTSTSDFSTDTKIVDLRSGRELLDLADVEVSLAGKPFDGLSSEVWGVTFPGGTRYYATLASDEFQREGYFLIEGDVRSEQARVIGRGVECPSLSPDGKRIAYKRRIGDTNRWRLHVRDLDGGSDVALAETRSIDDQPEWLSDGLVAYSDDESTYVVAADGSGKPLRLAASATSPVRLAP